MKKHKNLLLLAAIVVIIVGAFLFAPKGVEYSGTDDAAENAISTIQKDYKPWFSPLFEPPGSEVESLPYKVASVQGSSSMSLATKEGRSIKINKYFI